MSKRSWTWPVATLAFALSAFATGCSDSCDDLDELCDSCSPELRDDCIRDKANCSYGVSGPVGNDLEDDCCERELELWDLEC